MTDTTTPSHGAAFHQTFGDNLHRGGNSDRHRDRLVHEENARLKSQQYRSATVINLHAYPLTLNLGELGSIDVPATTPDGLGRTTIRDHRLAMRDGGEGNFTPVGILPIELAREFDREFGPTGGVFSYEGDGDPCAAKLEEAVKRQREWWKLEYQKAVDSWTRYHQHKLITDRQRDAARELLRLELIPALPEWVAVAQGNSDRRACPQCAESIKLAAKICHFCQSKLDTEAEN